MNKERIILIFGGNRRVSRFKLSNGCSPNGRCRRGIRRRPKQTSPRRESEEPRRYRHTFHIAAGVERETVGRIFRKSVCWR
jgi:hypothetical protein